MAQESVFNCLLIGKKSAGRASFLRHHIPREHLKGHTALSGVGVMMHPLIINASVGTIQFNIFDIDGMHGKCLVPTDCAVIFEGSSNSVALKSCPTWQTDLVVVIESIKLTLACADEPFNSFGDLSSSNNWMESSRKKTMQLDYYNLLNLESPHNVEKVFLWLARKLLNDKKIEFFSYPVFLPRFFVKARKAEQELCCHCFYVMLSKRDQSSSTSSSSSTTSGSHLKKEDTTERKGGGDCKNCIKQSKKDKSNDEVDKKDEEEIFFDKTNKKDTNDEQK